MLDIELQEVFETLEIFESIFDRMRIADPSINKIINYHEQEITEGEQCYLFFEKGKVCKNCVSIHAFHHNKVYQKTENISDITYNVTAIPIELSNRRVVLELLKSTEQKLSENELMEVYNLTDIRNNLAFRDPLTALYNKRYVLESLPVDFILGTIAKHSVSCFMVEIPLYQGDEMALKLFAQRLKELVQKRNSWVARLEEDLFFIFLPNYKQEELIRINEEISKLYTYKEAIRTSLLTLKPGQVRTAPDVITTLKKQLN